VLAVGAEGTGIDPSSGCYNGGRSGGMSLRHFVDLQEFKTFHQARKRCVKNCLASERGLNWIEVM